MSRFDEIKEQFENTVQQLREKISESATYQQLQDRYQSLSPVMQKAISAGGIILVAAAIFYYPLSLLQTSSENVSQFENQRDLIRELFKTHRNSGSNGQLMPAPPVEQLISQINGLLQNQKLLPEQILGVNAGTGEGQLIPQNLLSYVVDVKLAKLNLRQIVDIGGQLSHFSEVIKLKDFFMTENPQAVPNTPGYFDVTYKLYTLNVPAPQAPPPPEVEKPTKKKKKTDEDSGKDEG